MIQPQIQQGLERLFINDGARVVLWHDAAQEFVASVGELSVDGVDILRLDEIGSLEAKIHIESGGKEQRYLVYAPFEEPAADNDWLLDIRLYGRSFRADSVSILFDELGLSSQALRTHLASRQKFLRAKDRVERLKKWVAAQDSESALDLKMLAVLTRAEQADSFSVLTKLYIALANESGSDLFQMTKQWQEIISLDLEQAFWDLMGRTFGYVQDAPSLMDLLLRLLVTDFSLSVRGALPQALKSFVLPEYSLAATAAVFMSQWRNNVTAAAAYDQLSRRAAGELKIADHLGSIDHGVLADAMTFEDIEKALFRDLRDRVVSESPDLKLAEIRELIQRRRDGHWTSPMRRGDGLNAFRIGYDAIEAAAGLLLLKAESSLSFAYSSAADAIRSYLDSLYRFDQLYRHFHEAADVVEMAGWDVLKSLQSRVEEAYSGWFIPHLANAWGSLFAGEQGLLRNWMAYGVQSQTQFYASHVAPVLEQSPRSKVYVLISDAFRYEAAEELTQELNGKYRVGATLTAQLGVLPSYTALGMAALLPHTQLAYKQSLDVLVDGRSSTGIEQRGKILADHGGVAIHASDLMAMNKDAGREFVKGRRVIYIYHNQVDAVGDSASTESKTFAAVRTAIRELTSLVRFIIDSLNGTTVLVTADHGFLYQDSALDAFDKSALDEKPAGTIKAKKRYLIGQALGEHPKAWCGNTRITAGMDPGMEFWVPKGANRFHFTGGARFTHGGAMPQEILVPVITVRELEGRAAERTAIRKVDVSLLGSTKKIVNNVQRFEFIQNDAVSERIHSRTLLISLRDGNELISNEVTLTFNSTSEKIDERKQTARITLQAGQYPKTGTYALVLIDADTKVEIDRVSFTIDLAISNDFLMDARMSESPDTSLDDLLNRDFAGKVVRKDLTKMIKEGANVPVYVLEYLLGMYCASNDDEVIREGMENVKRILAENYVRPDEAEKVKSKIRELGAYRVIDKVTVKLNEKRDVYEALLSNLGVKGVEISSATVKRYEKLLAGGIWCIVSMSYYYEENQKGSPFGISELKPIQMPNTDLEEFFQGRRAFDEDQWMDALIRSTGMEPTVLEPRVKWHLLARMIPLVENNYNLCELGPRGTGKSHIYKEISPNSILVSGGQTTVANLFYNMGSRKVGLVGLWDVVAFDEVAGISFKDADGIQIMKDYMASGSFSRGRDAISANASMVFIGNINQSVETLVRTSHLLAPFPDVMIDTAFFDRFHAYVPGWEIPKMRPEFFTDQFGLIVDYLAECLRELRKQSFADAIDKYYKLGNNLNQRDTIAVRRTVSGLLKLLYPHGEYTKDAVKRCLEYALEVRRRVKEQLKKIGGMEFYDVHFSYIDNETREEHFVSVPEQGGGGLIPDSQMKPGTMHTVAQGKSGMLGLYRLETQVVSGNGKLTLSGVGSAQGGKEPIKIAFDYFKANVSRISGSAKPGDHDIHLHIVELNNTGPSETMTLAGFVAFCSGLLGKAVQNQMVVLGDMSLGGSIVPVESLAQTLQVAFDSGAKRILIPMSSVGDIPSVPGELFAKFQTSFYSDPVDAVFKALGVD